MPTEHIDENGNYSFAVLEQCIRGLQDATGSFIYKVSDIQMRLDPNKIYESNTVGVIVNRDGVRTCLIDSCSFL